MRARGVIAALLLAACSLPQQLASPCVGMPVSANTCPACTTDADCAIISNPCHEAASCVPKAAFWAVDAIGCDFEHAPTTSTCGCVNSVCQKKP